MAAFLRAAGHEHAVRGFEEAFAFFAGVPEELLFDQMKAVVTKDLRLLGGQLVINDEFLLCGALGRRACRPYRAKIRGKVERPIHYVRENFVYAREFLDDAHLDAERERWLAKANARVHATMKERPAERFEHDEPRKRTGCGEDAENWVII